MHSHLKTFVSTLAALDKSSKSIAKKLTRVHAHKNVLPEVSLTLVLFEHNIQQRLFNNGTQQLGQALTWLQWPPEIYSEN